MNSENADIQPLNRTWTAPNSIDLSPDASDVITTMPSLATRGMLYIIVAFITTAIVWAAVAKVDLVATGRGTLVPQGKVRPVQPAGSGVVQNIFFREGDKVERGEVLIQLDASEMRTRLTKLRQELETSQSQLRQMMVNAPVADTLEQQNRIARLQSEVGAAETQLQHTAIVAPVSGIITSMTVRTTGEVLQPGQTIATVAPSEVPFVVEVAVPNKDIAFVDRGLPAQLKFDAFPFQDYGIVEGTVIQVSPDASSDTTSSKDEESFYKVTIAPGKSVITAGEKNVSLRPGMSVTAEIITERRSVLSFLLEPVRKFKYAVSR